MIGLKFFSRYLAAIAVFAASGCATWTQDGHRSYRTLPHSIPGTIETENYDAGPPGYAYVDSDEVNHGAHYRRKTHVDIEARDDASNGHGIGWTRASEWLTYTVDVEETGTYSIEIPVASDRQGGSFHIEMDGVNVSGAIAVPDTGGWTELETIRVDNVELNSGRQVLTLRMDTEGTSGSIGDIDCLRFIKTP